MSRRIKPDRRPVVSQHTPIEIVHVTEHPGTPPELIRALVQARDRFWRISARISDEMYREDLLREGMAIDCSADAENIHFLLQELRLIPDDSTD